MDEEREIAGVAGLDEERDARRQGEEASEGRGAAKSHNSIFVLPQGFPELKAQPCKRLAEWPA